MTLKNMNVDSLKSKIKDREKEIQGELKSKNILKEKRYINEETLEQLNMAQQSIMSYFENRLNKNSNLYDLKDYIECKQEEYYRINKREKITKEVSYVDLEKNLKNLSNKIGSLYNGVNAENQTKRIISFFADRVKCLTNVRVGYENDLLDNTTMAENDVIIIGKRGIFSLEVKYSKVDMRIKENGNFEKVIKVEKDKSKNIVEQCLHHKNAIRRVLEDELKEKLDIEITPVIVFASNDSKIIDEYKKIPVLYKAQIEDYILNEAPCERELTEEEIEKYTAILESRRCAEGTFEHNIEMDKIIDEIAAFVAWDENYNEFIEAYDVIEKEKAKINYDNQAKEKEKRIEEAKKIRREQEKRNKRQARIIGLVIAASVIICFLVVKGKEYLEDKAYYARVSVTIEEFFNKDLDEDDSNYMNVFGSVSKYEAKASMEYINNDKALKDKIIKNIKSSAGKEKKVNDIVSVCRNNTKVDMKKFNLDLKLDDEQEGSGKYIDINGERLSLPLDQKEFAAGIYDIVIGDSAQGSKVEHHVVLTEDTTLEVNLSKGKKTSDIIVQSGLEGGAIYINGEATNLNIRDGVAAIKGVVKGDTKIKVEVYFPWGKEFSNEVTVNSSEININYNYNKDNGSVNEIIAKAVKEINGFGVDGKDREVKIYGDSLSVEFAEDGKNVKLKCDINYWDQGFGHYERNEGFEITATYKYDNPEVIQEVKVDRIKNEPLNLESNNTITYINGKRV